MPTSGRIWLVPLMRAWRWVRRSQVDFGLTPSDGTTAHAPGSNGDRILVFGSGPAVGWGVRSQDLALPGCLARAVGARTGRGADVDLVADVTITIANAVHWLSSVSLERYDAIIIVLGLGDALALTSAARWSRDLSRLVDHLVETVPRSTPIVVTGIPGLWSIPAYSNLLGRVAERHAACLDSQTRKACDASARIAFVPLSSATTRHASTHGFGGNYRAWATEIADAVVPPLDVGRTLTARNSVGRLRDVVSSKAERGEMVHALGLLEAAPTAELDRILDDARQAFGTSGAALVILDEDTLWVVAQTGGLPSRIPLSGPFADVVVTHRGAFVVPDALTDPNFRNLPAVAGPPHLRFWAGFPIESETGVRIGALSVFDKAPRDPETNGDRSVLRYYGLKAQDAIASIARSNPAT